MGQACDRIDPAGGDYVDGRSKLYGFGRINAERAVRLAQPEVGADTVTVVANFATPIEDLRQSEVRLQVAETRDLVDIAVHVEIQHTYIGDLVVTLVPPPATGVGDVVLHQRTGRSTNNISRTYSTSTVPGLAGLVGKSPKGSWSLRVEDLARLDTGFVRRFGLELTPVVDPAARTTEPVARKVAKRKARKTPAKA